MGINIYCLIVISWLCVVLRLTNVLVICWHLYTFFHRVVSWINIQHLKGQVSQIEVSRNIMRRGIKDYLHNTVMGSNVRGQKLFLHLIYTIIFSRDVIWIKWRSLFGRELQFTEQISLLLFCFKWTWQVLRGYASSLRDALCNGNTIMCHGIFHSISISSHHCIFS